MNAMSRISFKQYSEVVDENTSEDRLNEIFGLFRNNAKIEKLKKDREKLLAAKKLASAEKDAAFARAKQSVDGENRAEQFWKNKTARSHQADARGRGELEWAEKAGMREGLVTEAMRHDHDALVKSLNHFGSRAENPDGYRDLMSALKIADMRVPDDKIWAYNFEDFADVFTRISRKLKVQNFDQPDLNDLLRAKFERVKRLNGSTFLKKGNVIAILSKDDKTTYLVLGKDLVTESIDE
jgi:hypothetical protein